MSQILACNAQREGGDGLGHIASPFANSGNENYDIAMYYPVPLTGEWVSHIFLSLATGFAEQGVKVAVSSVHCAPGQAAGCARLTLPRNLYRVLCKVGLPSRPVCDRILYSRIKNSTIAYLWPGAPLWMYQKLKRRGVAVVAEMINCHVGTSSRILQEVYAEEGLSIGASASQATLDHEHRRLSIADYIFSPSPLVSDSLIENGVDARKILQSSYGFCPTRFAPPVESERGNSPLTFLFVGSGILRKGLHILLRAWRALKVRPRLLIAGAISPDIASRYEDVLSCPSVKPLGHVKDVGSLMQRADVFVFPSFEEGSPLVVYEAMASGLPVIVTPMAAGNVVRDEVEGIVVPAFSVDQLVAAMECLASNRSMREEYGRNAQQRAMEFTWSKVAVNRLTMLKTLHSAHRG